MDARRFDLRQTARIGLSGWIGLLATHALPAPAFPAKHFSEPFTGPKTSWTLRASRTVRTRDHRRIRNAAVTRGYEFFQLESTRRGSRTILTHALPAAIVIADLRLSLRLIANRNGATVYVRVVFPGQRDPRDGGPLTALIEGERYTQAGKWQTLTGRVPDRKVRGRLRELREQLQRPGISSKDMFVDGVVIIVPSDPGVTQIGIAELKYGPIVSPAREAIRRVERTERADAKHPAEFRLDRLRVRGFPFLPRIVAFHNERPDDLKAAGLNVAWIPRYDDNAAIASLRKAGLWITATPPGGPAAVGTARRPARPIDEFGRETRSILFWYFGTRIPESSQKRVVEWVDRVRRADRRFARPIMGDVAGIERIYSRYLPMLGTSRHALHTSLSLKQYRDWLIQRGKLARPGSFLWTWIQTEPAVDRPGASAVVVEPEQLRLQVYAALAAGCRGIGYWKTTRLDAKTPGAAERRLAISQLNLELDLLAPWITTGTVVVQRPFTIQERAGDRIGQRRLDFFATDPKQRDALLRRREDRIRRKKALGGELEAAVIRSDYGTLLLPIWYEQNAQFTPGRMTANNARIIVHGISRSASAWEVTTTGIRSLKPERVTGGIRITIPRFDQTAAVILTANLDLIEQLRKRIRDIAPRSARILVELARKKYERVRRLDAELARLDRRQTDAPQILRKAAVFLGDAKYALDHRDYDAARLKSGNTMQLLRILQRAHWNDAARRFASGVCSPQTLCFQTLPEHWRLVSRFGQSRGEASDNLLRSGDFEDIDTMIAEGWKHTQNPHPAIRAVAELFPKGKQGSYSLRLVAAPRPGRDQPKLLEKPSVTVTSPPMTVRSGQIVHISGWVKVATPIVGNLDGALLYESLAGVRGALRWNSESGWKRFTLLREVKTSGEMRITLMLKGMGEIRFDDLRVTVHQPLAEDAPTPPREPPTRRGPLNLLDRFPGLPSLRRLGLRR
ncbi:MAG: hypothetical protein ACE5KM_07610 [Planctomycetaceae bacterium]